MEKAKNELLILGNNSTLDDLVSVLKTFKDEHLSARYKGSRTIAEILQHIHCSQNCMYLNDFIMNNKRNCECNAPKTIKEAISNIEEMKSYFTQIIKELNETDFKKEFTTEWGQDLTKEKALFQSITHTSYHLSEICFIAGLNNFYQGTLG